MYGFTVPSYEYGNYTILPDGRTSNCEITPKHYHCDVAGAVNTMDCNFEAYIDSQILGLHYNWDGPTRPSDPEGPWGYLTSVFNTFMGICTCLLL